MRLIHFFFSSKKQIKLQIELSRKETQYKLIQCCQFATKDEEGKVNRYSWNTAIFFVCFFLKSNFSYYKMILGNNW